MTVIAICIVILYLAIGDVFSEMVRRANGLLPTPLHIILVQIFVRYTWPIHILFAAIGSLWHGITRHFKR